MARPLKDGLTYFPMDVACDEKMELIEAEFGVLGFGVIMKILQRIYAHSYYAVWTNEVALLFARQIGLGSNVVSEILSASIRRGIFHKDLFREHQVLTSAEIQENFFRATHRRTQVKVDERYLLVDPAIFSVHANIYSVNDDSNPKNVCNNSQRKVKESKVKESKVKESVPVPAHPHPRSVGKPELQEVLAYGKSEGMRCNPEAFFDYYEARGWQSGNGKPISSWKAALKGWERREEQFAKQAREKPKQARAALPGGSSIDKEALDRFIDNQFCGGEGKT